MDVPEVFQKELSQDMMGLFACSFVKARIGELIPCVLAYFNECAMAFTKR